MSHQSGVSYAGDMLSVDAYRLLESDATSTLIDVRMQAEWAYVGVPDLSPLDRTALFLEWQRFPAMEVDARSVVRLSTMLGSGGLKRGAPLVFICICRSGARSLQAAIAMTGAGWAPCFNVSDGFEGPLDTWRHRAVGGGWKAGGPPWAQT